MLSFIAVPPSVRPPAVDAPPTLGGSGSYTSARATSEGSSLQATTFVVACGALVAAAAARGGRRPSVARRAEEFSILGALGAEDKKEADEISKMEEELSGMDFELNEDSLNDGTVTMAEESEEEAARRGARQISYNLYPSRQYVLYIAKKNAERTWTKDGPDGRNKGCLEVQIAVLTERIRSMILHVRDFKHDYKCRIRLVSLVARRRRLLDKLSWKDLDSYLAIRKELKIRHVYRMEALIGRLPAYRFAIRDRKQAPGRKTAMRLKKTKRLLTTRLATQLRQGKPRMIIHKTQKALKSRQWGAREYDDAKNMINGKQTEEYIDPLNLP